VVVSESTHQLIAGQLASVPCSGQEGKEPAGLSLADLGWHRLKDIAEAEHLYQLMIPGLPDTFPPLKSLGNRGQPAQADDTVHRAQHRTRRCAGSAV
jgi:hypothetical protein